MLARGFVADRRPWVPISLISEVNALRLHPARPSASGGAWAPPPQRAPAAAPVGGGGTRPGGAGATPRDAPAVAARAPGRAEAAPSASVPRPQAPRPQPPAAAGSGAAAWPIPDQDFVVDRPFLLGEPGAVGSDDFLKFKEKLRECVEVKCVVRARGSDDVSTTFAPVVSWIGSKSYKSKTFRTEALQIHTYLCKATTTSAGGDGDERLQLHAGRKCAWSDLRDNARAYGRANQINDWAAALRTCISERSNVSSGPGEPAAEQSAE